MGQPRKKIKDKLEPLPVRVCPKSKKKIARMAKSVHITIGAYVRQIIEHHLEEQGVA